jgi:hypothetical protein
MTTAPATFTVGQTYTCRSACDHTTVFSYTVIKRTAKFITIEDSSGRVKRVGALIDSGRLSDGGEFALPQGSFSMAPVIKATAATPAPKPTRAPATSYCVHGSPRISDGTTGCAKCSGIRYY